VNRSKLWRIYSDAFEHMRQEHPDDLRWAKGLSVATFRKQSSNAFMAEYAWVVYAAGFRVSTLRLKWPALRKAYGAFRLEYVAGMKSMARVLKVFNNPRKARSVIEGAGLISSEGFKAFKRRMSSEGAEGLLQLPGIGPITKDHLARNIGLAATGKGDIWIVRIARAVGTTDWIEMLAYVSRRARLSPGTVDIIFWEFCADNAWRTLGYRSFSSYVRSR